MAIKMKINEGSVEDAVHTVRCIDAVANTAARLGVDPVALAEAAQDGNLFYHALELVSETYTRLGWQSLSRINDRVEALKARKAAD